MRSMVATAIALAAFANASAWSRPAAADPPPARDATKDSVAAESLFEDARALVAAGHFAEACPKFVESERIDPSVATLLNLAHCWEKVGRIATAWAAYRQAASAADAAGRKDYLATALRRAEALAPRIPRLTIRVAAPVPGLVVQRDGDAIDAGQWGVAMPVDPGAHVVEAKAPDFRGWSQSVEVTPDALRSEVTVPQLEALPQTQAPAPVGAPVAAAPEPAAVAAVRSPRTPPPIAPSNTQRVVGLVVGGLGLAGLAVSGVTAIVAKNKDTSSRNECEPSNPDLCSPAGLSERNDARAFGDAATVSFVVGAAATALGAVLWLSAPSESHPASASGSANAQGRPSPGGATPPSPAGLSLRIAPSLGGASLMGMW